MKTIKFLLICLLVLPLTTEAQRRKNKKKTRTEQRRSKEPAVKITDSLVTDKLVVEGSVSANTGWHGSKSIKILPNDFFNSDDGRRLFGIISAGGSLGAFFGTSVTQYFALEVCGSDISDTGPSFLIIFSIVCLCISIFLARDLHVEDSNDSSEKKEIGGSASDAIKSLISVPEVRNIAVYVLLFTTLATIAWMMSLDIIREWSSDPCERTSYFSFVEQVVIPLTLIMQVLFSSFLMRRFGTLIILVIYGLLFAIAFSVYYLFPVIAAVFTISIMQRLFEYGLNKPTRETYYADMKKNDRYKSTVLVDTFISRTGDLTGGWIVGFGLITLSISWAALPLALLLSLTGYKAAKSIR